MEALQEWLQDPMVQVLIGFHIFIIIVLYIDLGVVQKKAHAVTMKESGIWVSIWVSCALIFGVGVWQFRGGESGMQFLTGYLIELALSVDNLFVFLVIFSYFAVPNEYRHRVLFWGIIGAVLMRATFILIGAEIIKRFAWSMYIFGAFLIFTGFKLLRSGDHKSDPGKNPVVRFARRFLPITENYEGSKFFVRRGVKLIATPMFLVLLVVETTDVVFAVDSIPAIFGITKDTFIVYTSNIFAILGLRAMYFLLAGFLGYFRYLNYGLAFVLMFIGIKMVVQQAFDFHIPPQFALGGVVVILGTAIVASIKAGPEKKEEVLGVDAPSPDQDPKEPPNPEPPIPNP